MSSSINNFRRWKRADGFTLVEAMMGIVMGAMLMAGILSTYVFCLKAYQAISNYREIHSNGRRGVDWFAKDMRGVSAIKSFNSSNLVVTVPTGFNSAGVITNSKTITYTCKSCSNTTGVGTLWRTDSSTGMTTLLATNIYSYTVTLFDRVGNVTALTNVAKGVQIDVKLRKRVMNQIQSEDYIAARLDMRNK